MAEARGRAASAGVGEVVEEATAGVADDNRGTRESTRQSAAGVGQKDKALLWYSAAADSSQLSGAAEESAASDPSEAGDGRTTRADVMDAHATDEGAVAPWGERVAKHAGDAYRAVAAEVQWRPSAARASAWWDHSAAARSGTAGAKPEQQESAAGAGEG